MSFSVGILLSVIYFVLRDGIWCLDKLISLNIKRFEIPETAIYAKYLYKYLCGKVSNHEDSNGQLKRVVVFCWYFCRFLLAFCLA